ncbi:MAG: hypothetical protein WC389_04930 [Lutibacter sp.]
MKKTATILLFLAILTSCKTVVVNKQTQKIASSALELATIGKTKPNLQINTFEINAIPQLNKKIRVTAMVLPFNRAAFKAYIKAANLQGKRNVVKYVDSLSNKPMYVALKITDNVTLLEELNGGHNVTIFNYLKTVPNANMISEISMVFDASILSEIDQAEELYLSNVKYKKYDLELYRNGSLHNTIELTKGITFAYKLSSFCWGENGRHQPILVDIIDEHLNCNNNTQNSFQKVIKKKQSIKF